MKKTTFLRALAVVVVLSVSGASVGAPSLVRADFSIVDISLRNVRVEEAMGASGV